MSGVAGLSETTMMIMPQQDPSVRPHRMSSLIDHLPFQILPKLIAVVYAAQTGDTDSHEMMSAARTKHREH